MKVLMGVALLLLSSRALAGKNCEELKAEIEKKVQANGVPAYTLEILPTAEAEAVKDAKIVGRCEGGKKRIVYKRGARAA